MIAGRRHRFQAYTRRAMPERAPKRKTNAKRGPAGVLGTLPASRPERIGKPRRGAAKNGAKPVPAAAAAKTGRPATPRPEAVRPACPPLRPGKRDAFADATATKPIGAPTGTELVTTTIRAAGELAHIGFVVGGQVL